MMRRLVLSLALAYGILAVSAASERLFVLGYTNLYELAYHSADLSVCVKRTWNYEKACQDSWGHDLVADGRGGYYFSNHTAVWRFDPDRGAFVRELEVKNIKSFSRDEPLGDLLSVPRTHYWTDRMLLRGPNGQAHTVGLVPGARFYKARWMPKEKGMRK